MTRDAFLNAIRVNSAIGGSTNAPIHLAAIARHLGVELSIDDWQSYGRDIPLLVNLQPAGEYLGEDYYRAGGVPAVTAELMRQGLIRESALTANGRSIGDNCRDAIIEDDKVIRPFGKPLKENAGFSVLRGNLFDSAIMKLSVVSAYFRKQYLSDADDPGAGPVGYPGAAEVVNMRAPAALLARGVEALPCIGDGRQSGTSGSPSILNASPEAAVNGPLALLKTGDRIRVDLRKGEVNALVPDDEWQRRRAELEARGGYAFPDSQTPWQEMQRAATGQLGDGAPLEPAVKYRNIAATFDPPRDNH
jgi:dihydroxy-acid dehydratase